MRFTESPVVELAVGGATLFLQQDNGSMHVGTSVWPASLVLVKFLERCLHRPNPRYAPLLLSLPRARAVELGSGCGPAGMGLALLGLRDLLLTDIAPVLPALRRNLKRNRHLFPGSKPPRHAQLYWEKRSQIEALSPPFDIVIAADVVYMEDSARHLVSAMEALLADDGVVLLGYQIRSPEAHAVFWERCSEVFDAERVPKEDLHPEYAYEESDVFFLRKKMKKIEQGEGNGN